jgi:hypothetical protein
VFLSKKLSTLLQYLRIKPGAYLKEQHLKSPHMNRLERFARGKRSSLFGFFVGDKEKVL